MSDRHPLFGRPLPKGWRLLTVDEIRAEEPSSCVAGPFGSNISSKYFVPEGVPFIRGNNLRDDLTRFVPRGFAFVSEEQAKQYRPQHVKAGDLVFTCWGTIGQVGLIPQGGPFPEYIISNKQLKLRPNRKIADPLFLFYYFASPQMVQHIRSIAIGAAVPGINLGLLKSLRVSLPPISEQKKIAAALTAYDDLIENNTRRIRILEEMAQAIYREWFVHFRFPGHKKAKLVPSPLGPIPEGWEARKLGDECEIVMGQSPKSEFYNEHGKGLPFHQGVTDFGPHFPTDRVYCTVENRIAEAGDILFSVRAPVGRINVTLSRMIIGRGLCAIRNRRGNQTFTLHQLKERFSEEDTIGGGTIFKAVTKEDVHGIGFLLPNGQAIRNFEGHCQSLDKMIALLTQKNARLRATRDLLLPKLISGELDVSNLDINVEDAAA